ncbi:DUF2069 domain-containing protein [Dechloromonas sp. TW-R-39-2]|uniref:DUF2069 domain-containing protein n=1 Tax=Dechloromonas sp. TW-R-39-2 TaxID=2654218 RepID=UPI00193D34A3|nr:DUF2069 domain-containing protein [Dechloromonas sp. TW-R-39-2]QRM19127.1 DUF2069 domain-containing protein [Dechloromonas sp. TW-R-39-2]
MTASRYQFIASTSLIALIFLCLAWEAWLAPLKPGGSWLILKAVFLLAPLFGILRGKRYTYKWVSLFIQFYLLEGLTRSTSEHGLSQWLAAGETVLALILFTSTILYIRATRPVLDETKAAQQS